MQDQLAQAGRQVLQLEQPHHWPVIKGVLRAEKVDSEAAQALTAAPLAVEPQEFDRQQGQVKPEAFAAALIDHQRRSASRESGLPCPVQAPVRAMCSGHA